jgi:hypothetical protein
MEFFIVFSKGGLLLWQHNFDDNEELQRQSWINQFLRNTFLEGPRSSSSAPFVFAHGSASIEPTFIISCLEFRWIMDHTNGLIYLVAYPSKFPLKYAPDLLEDTRLLFPGFHRADKTPFFTHTFERLLQKYREGSAVKGSTTPFRSASYSNASMDNSMPESGLQSNSSVNDYADDERVQFPESGPASPAVTTSFSRTFVDDPLLAISKGPKGSQLGEDQRTSGQRSKRPGKMARTWDFQVSKQDAASLDFTEAKVSRPSLSISLCLTLCLGR